jgi:NAD(P)-dependent dehydrogenase (short-subunit alcohol dehydrogenase family)
VPGEELLETMPDQRRAQILRMARSDRIGRADDIAAMVSFLLSDDGAWVTAQVLGVDGGNTMRP